MAEGDTGDGVTTFHRHGVSSVHGVEHSQRSTAAVTGLRGFQHVVILVRNEDHQLD